MPISRRMKATALRTRRPPVPVGKPPRLTGEQARARGRNVRKPRSR